MRLKLSIQIVLAAVVVALAYIVYRQITDPLDFRKEAALREAAVTERIKDIRSAEEAFRLKHRRYTADFDSLIGFVLNDSLVFERRTGSLDDSAAVANGLVRTEKFTIAVRDTVFSPRRLTTEQVEELRYIPYAKEGTEYILDAGMLPTESKVVVPVFEVKAPYKDFLYDMDRQMLVNLINDASIYNKYPGIAAGSD